MPSAKNNRGIIKRQFSIGIFFIWKIMHFISVKNTKST